MLNEEWSVMIVLLCKFKALQSHLVTTNTNSMPTGFVSYGGAIGD